MLRIKCPTQSYAWGRKAKDECEVAALISATGKSIDPDKPYAELWMGTHPNGQAFLAASDTLTLRAWLDTHPIALGNDVLQRFGGGNLPFLFKVLSVETALSIQSHPDKALAQRLHADRPQVYKDGNHKPEMAIAISDFEALCGFISTKELLEVVQSYPEIQPCLGAHSLETLASKSGMEEQRDQLKQIFTSLMTCEQPKVSAAITALQGRLKKQQEPLDAKEALVLRLNEQYPDDVGVLAALFLNLLHLQEGQAIYLGANIPHAYISGEIVECMATSDNVLRAGLTPKLRDTEVLCSSLAYTQGLPPILDGEEIQQYTAVYTPPFEEFEVFKIHVPPQAATLVPASQGPVICLVQSGSGRANAKPSLAETLLETTVELKKGEIFFVPAQTPLALTAGQDNLLIWLAAVNSKVFSNQFEQPKGVSSMSKANVPIHA